MSASPAYSLYFSKPEDGTYGWSGADYSLWSDGFLDAIVPRKELKSFLASTLDLLMS